MQDLVRGLRQHATISAPPGASEEPHGGHRRRSARLANNMEHLHDSGTESDDEELELIDQATLSKRSYDEFLSGANPPALSGSPAVDWEGESRDSVGRESGILTGDNFTDSEDEDSVTPKPRRRMMGGPSMERERKNVDCEMAQSERRKRNDAKPRQKKIVTRSTIVAARRCPVKLLVNRPPVPPPSSESEEEEGVEKQSNDVRPPSNKRIRLSRPSLDFDKMLQTRMQSTAGSVSSAFQSIRQRRRIFPSGPSLD